ncbi:MAG: hypothetical protein IH585_08250 [Anaerolineaceae bacterium]|nr:hypothetical protein [Anaerolineaceae bacterium]
MSGKNRKANPNAFIAIGVCYMGAGVALSAALQSKGASAIGIALVGVGIAFIVIGIVNRQKGQSGQQKGEDRD